MTMTDTMTSGSRTVTAMFDTSAESERAVMRLKGAGIPESSIRVTQGSAQYNETTYQDEQKGFWESLGDFFFPDEDRYTYAEGLARGAHVVTVTGFDDAYYDTIVDILDDEGSVDLSARETEWRSAGWSGYDESDYARSGSSTGISSAAAGMGAAATGVLGGGTGSAVDYAAGGEGSRGTINDDGMSDRQMAADVSTSGTAFGSERSGFSGASGSVDDEGTVKVMEEHLAVGKRDVDMGSVRVRSYVREEPVSADVALTSTRVMIERRAVDRPAGAGDIDFQDRTIEAREHAEEAVVAKEARIVEEIGLRKETESHTQTVSDTVRKTEVEIEDERTGERTSLTGDATTGTTGRDTTGRETF